MTNSGLLVNLAFALGAAFLGGLLAVRLGQSVILGYIAAGILIGPYTPGFVGDPVAVQALADIGIIFLMFAIGVGLSLSELLRLGRVAILGGSAQVIAMIGVGYVVGLGLGWQPLEALFFGAVISNSSSTVLGKVLGELGQADAPHGRIGLAWSSIQDISTIVLVVILSALATGGEGLWGELVWSVGKATLFLVAVAVLGARVFPPFFDRVAGLRNRELFIGMVAAIALGMAYLASFFGLSVALGAFVAGVVVGESDLSHQILGEVVPLRDLFAGLFFVSVGMLVDPFFVVANLPLVGLVLALIVVVKGTLIALLTRLAGYPIVTAVLTGVALGQSAEFSFLLARLGAELGVLTAPAFSLMLAGAVASIMLSPALHHLTTPARLRTLERLPLLGRGVAELAETDPAVEELRRHTVICGYGRVGRELASTLERRGFRYLVIEYNVAIVRDLRARGVPAIYGDASNPAVLEQARPGQAVVLAVLIPDARVAALATSYARARYPRLDIVARAANAEQVERLERAGATEAVQPEFEAGLEVIRHTLRRYGISGMELLSVVEGRRAAFYRRAVDQERESETERAPERSARSGRVREVRIKEQTPPTPPEAERPPGSTEC